MNLSKNLIQEEALNSWIQSDRVGTIVLPTGSGKTRVGVLAINALEKNSPKDVLIVVPTTNLKDNEWKNELKKWSDTDLHNIRIECIQTARKGAVHGIKSKYDLIIVDEVHTTLSEENSKFYTRIQRDQLLCLTATLPENEEYLSYLLEIAPVVYSKTVQDSVDLKLVEDFSIYNIGVTFSLRERAKYRAQTKMLHTSRNNLTSYGNKLFPRKDAFEVANNPKDVSLPNIKKDIAKFWRSMSSRRWLCYRAEKKIDLCVEIIKNRPHRKWIIFCHDTKWAEELNEKLRFNGIFSVCYHSKLKKKDKEQVLRTAKSKLCRVICSAQALTTGYNLPDLNGGISVSSTSVERSLIQELGRNIRLKEESLLEPIYISMYVKNTQEQSWVEKKTANFNIINISKEKEIQT